MRIAFKIISAKVNFLTGLQIKRHTRLGIIIMSRNPLSRASAEANVYIVELSVTYSR